MNRPVSSKEEGTTGVPRLGRRFFGRYTPVVAKELLGMLLVRVLGTERLSGIIVETEAYRGVDDPASHAYRGLTRRNGVMFGEGGHAYVYFSYGSHWCLNVTTEPQGTAGAVLIRAVEPVEGMTTMRRNRGLSLDRHIADGPGKLTRALAIDSSLNGEDMVTSSALFIEKKEAPAAVGVSHRIGISLGKQLKWRFFVTGSRFVSRAKPCPSQNPEPWRTRKKSRKVVR